MRKILKGLPAIVAVLFLISLAASPLMAGAKFGLKGGITLANIKSVPETFEGYEWENKQGLVGGVFAEVGLAKGFSLQPEVLYVQKGPKISFSEGEVSGTMKVNVDYIEIPLLLKCNLVSRGSTVPSIYAGPFVGFLTKAEMTMKITGYPEEKEDIKDNMKSTDYGVAFGVGLSQHLGAVKLTLDARYDLGLANVAKPETEGPESIKTRTWLFMVGFGF